VVVAGQVYCKLKHIDLKLGGGKGKQKSEAEKKTEITG